MDLSQIAVIDQHAHTLLLPEAIAAYPYTISFTEGFTPEHLQHHARHSLCYRRSLREIAALLECEPEEAAILARRNQQSLEALTQHCLQAAQIDTLLLDNGLDPDTHLPLNWHRQFVKVRRLVCLETLAEQLVSPDYDFETFLRKFRGHLSAPDSEVVAFKSIVAYRTGLNARPVPFVAAQASYYDLQALLPGPPVRLTNKRLLDFLLYEALGLAAQQGIPVQFHTGFGDTDLDLRLANPLYLRPILEDPRWRQVPIILLHAAYPFAREASYLASVYPQVYLDFGLAVPFLSVSGMEQTLKMLLELAPTTKILYSSDAHFIPELYYLGAKWGRQVLATVLEQAIAHGYLTANEAEQVAHQILHANARLLYKLDSSRAII